MVIDKESTKERILAATEELIAEHGFDGVSLRDITGSASVNVAAVNYHFGSKEKLYEQIQLRYIVPVNDERMALLAEATADGRVASVHEILDAFMRPFLTMVTKSEMSERLFFKLLGRCLSDQQGQIITAMMPSLKSMAEAFTQALSNACPDLPVSELTWRLHFTYGVMSNTLMHGDVMKQFADETVPYPDFDTQIEWMIDFCEAGFQAKGGDQR
ncbi:MAG: TetR/AcrR family transcriptional regulator [Akkermansiaceae bacterium]